MELKNLLNATDFEFKKKFGQNFISDVNLLSSICRDAELTNQDEVLEIGVGAGTLTKTISQTAKYVVGYEIDQTLQDTLALSLKDVQNAKIVFQDFLKADVDSIKKHFSKPFKVIANLPYYVTTDIILRLIDNDFNILSLTIMVQKEVAERLCAKVGTKDYGTLTAQIDSIADAKITRIVNRNMFTPQPNVDSAIVHIKFNRNKYDIKDWSFHQKVIRACFAMRRKTLANNLKSSLSMSTTQIDETFKKLSLDKNIRGENLTTKQLVELSNYLLSIK